MKIEFLESQLGQIVKKFILPCVQPGVVLLVKGPLGAGKTTMAKTLARELGVIEELTSPTFAYVNLYKNLKNSFGIKCFVHFDLYRLEGFTDFINLDLFDLVGQPGSLCFIEWPELIEQNIDFFSAIKKVFRLELSHATGKLDVRILELKL